MTPHVKGSKADRLAAAIRLLYVAGILNEVERERAFKRWAQIVGTQLSPQLLEHIKPK